MHRQRRDDRDGRGQRQGCSAASPRCRRTPASTSCRDGRSALSSRRHPSPGPAERPGLRASRNQAMLSCVAPAGTFFARVSVQGRRSRTGPAIAPGPLRPAARRCAHRRRWSARGTGTRLGRLGLVGDRRASLASAEAAASACAAVLRTTRSAFHRDLQLLAGRARDVEDDGVGGVAFRDVHRGRAGIGAGGAAAEEAVAVDRYWNRSIDGAAERGLRRPCGVPGKPGGNRGRTNMTIDS